MEKILTKMVEYDWELVIQRLSFQKERLKLTTEETKKYIKQNYRKTFKKLSDNEIIALGQSMANAKNKEEFLKNDK
jgi:hypothetical protein